MTVCGCFVCFIGGGVGELQYGAWEGDGVTVVVLQGVFLGRHVACESPFPASCVLTLLLLSLLPPLSCSAFRPVLSTRSRGLTGALMTVLPSHPRPSSGSRGPVVQGSKEKHRCQDGKEGRRRWSWRDLRGGSTGTGSLSRGERGPPVISWRGRTSGLGHVLSW